MGTQLIKTLFVRSNVVQADKSSPTVVVVAT